MITKGPLSTPGFGTEPALLIALGNPGRQDDGLGWAFAEAVAPHFWGEVVYRYQLQVEDAELISHFAWVFFADACRDPLPHGWDWQPCVARSGVDFSTHFLPPGTVMDLAYRLYGARPEAWLIRLAGMSWELTEGLSAPAQHHLATAVSAWEEMIRAGTPR